MKLIERTEYLNQLINVQGTPTQQLAVEAVKKIELIYHTDNKFKDSAYEER